MHAPATNANRHTVLIPVRDNPRQLERCLKTLSSHVQRFPLAEPIQVIIADNSRRKACNIRRVVAKQRAQTDSKLVELICVSPVELKAVWNNIIAGKLGDGFAWNKGWNIGQVRNAALLLAKMLSRGEEIFSFIDSDIVFARVSGVRNAQLLLEPLDYPWFSAIETIRRKSTVAATSQTAGYQDGTPKNGVISCFDNLSAFIGNGNYTSADGEVFVFDGMSFEKALAHLPRVLKFGLQGIDSWNILLSTKAKRTSVFEDAAVTHAGCLTLFGARGLEKPFPFGPVRNEDTMFGRLVKPFGSGSLEMAAAPRLIEHGFLLAHLCAASRKNVGVFIAREFSSNLFQHESRIVRKATGEDAFEPRIVEEYREALKRWVATNTENAEKAIRLLEKLRVKGEAKAHIGKTVLLLRNFIKQIQIERCVKAFNELVEPTLQAARNYDVLARNWSEILAEIKHC